MKISQIISIGLIASGLGLFPNMAKSLAENPEFLLSQFNINVDIHLPDSDSEEESTTKVEDSTVSKFEGFSGNNKEYIDSYNGFKLKIPVEFSLEDKGQTTSWLGPLVDGTGTLISINAAPLSGVSSQTLQQTYQQQYEQDRFYTDVTPFDIEYEGKTVPALRVKEINNQRGTKDLKKPDDIHRWHLFVFGNERMYSMILSASFQTFQEDKVQAVYEDTIASVELVTIKE